jgi:DNA invertase Pin-like site-specific DNA recombinase
MRKAALYLRVSTQDQITANQERELRAVADRMGCEIVHVYRDHGVGGAKGRDKRPQFDKLCRDATKRQFDMVMAWSVDRLGRSLQDLVAFLSEIHALKIDLYLHQQGIDTETTLRFGTRKTRKSLSNQAIGWAATHPRCSTRMIDSSALHKFRHCLSRRATRDFA